MKIGDKIKQYRKSLGMTQDELAKKVSVARVTIGTYERDESVPPLDIAMRIAAVLNVSLDMLCQYDWVEKSKPRSSGDLIRDMSNEELAAVCYNCLLDWLNQPADNIIVTKEVYANEC